MKYACGLCSEGNLHLDCPTHGRQAAAIVAEAIDRGVLVQAQPPGRCELCGVVAETRPYGPRGEEICIECGRRDPEATERAMARRFG